MSMQFPISSWTFQSKKKKNLSNSDNYEKLKFLGLQVLDKLILKATLRSPTGYFSTPHFPLRITVSTTGPQRELSLCIADYYSWSDFNLDDFLTNFFFKSFKM